MSSNHGGPTQVAPSIGVATAKLVLLAVSELTFPFGALR